MFSFWPFKRKSLPIARQWVGPKSVDWVVGDIAECIAKDDFWNKVGVPVNTVNPKYGHRYIVKRVFAGPCFDPTTACIMLGFIGMPNGYGCDGFRKIVPTEDDIDRKVTKEQPAPNKELLVVDKA